MHQEDMTILCMHEPNIRISNFKTQTLNRHKQMGINTMTVDKFNVPFLSLDRSN